jgi:hypothetical protein
MTNEEAHQKAWRDLDEGREREDAYQRQRVTSVPQSERGWLAVANPDVAAECIAFIARTDRERAPDREPEPDPEPEPERLDTMTWSAIDGRIADAVKAAIKRERERAAKLAGEAFRLMRNELADAFEHERNARAVELHDQIRALTFELDRLRETLRDVQRLHAAENQRAADLPRTPLKVIN